jgi:hypothetical protein
LVKSDSRKKRQVIIREGRYCAHRLIIEGQHLVTCGHGLGRRRR